MINIGNNFYMSLINNSNNTQIDTNLLIIWGAHFKKYEKKEIIFNEGDEARYYYQIEYGSIRMFNQTEDGKEFTQGLFISGESFGEPPLLLNKPYPANAQAINQTTLIKLSKDKFDKMLEENIEIKTSFLKLMAQRTYNKSNSSKSLALNTAEEKIIELFNQLKSKKIINGDFVVPFTRQEIANILGIRIETVIRTISKLKSENIIQIEKNKIIV